MADPVTVMQAAALVNVRSTTIAAYCRDGELESAYKDIDPSGHNFCWWLDLADLRELLRSKGRQRFGELPEPWSPIVSPARDGEPTEVQLDVLAGEWWHDLLNMDLRENGDLWTRWSDGERFLIRPNGELDQFRYERVGEDYRQQERQSQMEESNGHHEHHRQLQPHAQPA